MDEINEKPRNNLKLEVMSNNEPCNTPGTQEVEEKMINAALMAVMFKGETPSCASRKYGVKRTTILYRLLRERRKCSQSNNLEDSTDSKSQLMLGGGGGGGINAANIKRESDRKFQSKFTSQQLLSAQQEEDLSNYLREKYELQLRETSDPTLIPEATARNFVHDFVRINNIRYPASWAPKQQASGDWFNGFVDRNPEVIECVAPAVKLRRRRRRTKYAIKKVKSKLTTKRDSSDYDHEFGQWAVESVPVSHPKLTNIVDDVQYGETDVIQQNSHLQTEYTTEQNSFKIKIENNYDSADIGSQSEAQFVTSDSYYNEELMVPELVYQNPPSPNTEMTVTSNSIAQNVKRRTFRKPRVIPQILYSRNHIQRKDDSNLHNFHENLNSEDANTSRYYQNDEPNKRIEIIMERMHEDMGHYMQTIIAQMKENTRLLKELVDCQTRNSPRH